MYHLLSYAAKAHAEHQRTITTRMSICIACPLSENRKIMGIEHVFCKVCGCDMNIKTTLPGVRCATNPPKW
jgi:hypothetical protein